jgi:hypothetical protein
MSTAPRAVPRKSNQTNQADQVQWVKDFASKTLNTDISEVRALPIPGYTAGGGGLYMKKGEKGFDTKLQGAKDALGKRAGEADGVEAGKVVFIKELEPRAKPADALLVCWITFHEYGHAVGERQTKADTSEAYAHRFECAAILAAHSEGKLSEWGIGSTAGLNDFLTKRVSDAKIKDSAELKGLQDALQPPGSSATAAATAATDSQ